MKEYKYTIDGKKYDVTVKDVKEGIATVEVNGVEYKVEMEPEKEHEKPKIARPAPAPAQPKPTSNGNTPKTNMQDAVKAPLPGVIREITVKVGDEVKAGQTCVVLEAMKMANNLEAEKNGTVTAILVSPGQSVMEGEPLVAIE